MKAMSRRRFLQVAGATVLTATMASMPAMGERQSSPRRIRVRMVAPDPRPAELAFCRRARFHSAADAMRALASRGMAAEIYRE